MMVRTLAAVVLATLALAGAAQAQDGPPKPAARPPLAALEAGIVEELNRARTEPAGYAEHLEALLPQFDGTLRRTPEGLLQSREGAAAVREAIATLRGTTPMAPLQRSPGLSAAARDLARDQASSGSMGHEGSDGSTPADRVNRHGRWGGALSENVSYSAFASVGPRDVVVQLLVDDGVPGRGHRRNILDPTMRQIGVGCGPHARFAVVCVMDHAREYQEGPP